MNEMVLSSAADAASALDHAASQIRAGEVARALSVAALCDRQQTGADRARMVASGATRSTGRADGVRPA